MYRHSFLPAFLFCALLAAGSLFAQHYSGVSSSAGLPFPDRDLPGVAMSQAVVQLRSLDTVSEYRLVLGLENRSGEYQATEMVTPLQFYFNEFRPDLRAALLDRLRSSFPEEFAVNNAYDDIRDQLRDNFGKRLFIRKFISTMDLAKLGIACQAQVGDMPLKAKKIFLEFRWMDAERSEWAGTGQVLVMDLRVTHEVLLKPGERKNVEMRIKMPTLITGEDEAQYFAPFALAGPNRWDGPINKLFLVHDIRQATGVLPRDLAFQSFQEGEYNHVTLLEALAPREGDRIAFVDSRTNMEACEGTASVLSFPEAVTNVSASSWLDREKSLDGYRVAARVPVLLANDIPAYEHLSGQSLTLFTGEVIEQARPNPALERIHNEPCESGQASIRLDGYCNPVFAFDQGAEDGFQVRTAWCENADGPGTGEFIRFELLQPARAMRILNGYQLSEEKYNGNSRVRSLKLIREDGDLEKILPVSDLRILNLYDLNMPAGRYKLVIQSTYPGSFPTACLTGISFDFEVPDLWFRAQF